MTLQARILILVCFAGLTPVVYAQDSRTMLPAAPATKAAVGQWDVGIVQRAAKIIATPAQWNRADTGDCPDTATTFGILCALQRAADEAAGIHHDPGHAAAASTQSPLRSDCRFHLSKEGREGSCGPLFDEVPIFTIAAVKTITSGTWRTDAHPTAVWAGNMADAGFPVMYEARQLVDLVTTKKYAARLIDYNNDSTTTFADIQAFFHKLEDRVATQGASDLRRGVDSVEIEVYTGGTGVIRTYAGWFPISGFTARDSILRFQIDTAHEVPPSALDRAILQRAATIITADSVWNRADNRKCPTAATTWSIYCAVERAEIEVAGGFHHRRPAMELVRQIVDERSKDRSYKHRLMEYNNDPSTHLEDVRSLFAEALDRIK